MNGLLYLAFGNYNHRRVLA